jgi:uncharacterized protein (TIGR03067 family)
LKVDNFDSYPRDSASIDIEDAPMLRCLQFLALTVLLLGANGAGADDQKDKVLESLNGTWELASLEVNGTKVPADDLAGATMTVTKGNYVFKMLSETEEGSFKIDVNKKPATINLDIRTGESEGKKQLGIFDLTNSTWRLCLNDPGIGERPKEIHAKKGSKQLLFEFKKK